MYRHKRITVLDNDAALQQVPLGILVKVASIGCWLVIFDPQVVIFPGSAKVMLASRHGQAHNPSVMLDEDLLEVEVVSGKTDQCQAEGDQKACFWLLQIKRAKQCQQAYGECPKPVEIGNQVVLLAETLLAFPDWLATKERCPPPAARKSCSGFRAAGSVVRYGGNLAANPFYYI